jgi:hypothetical protein
MTGYGDAIARYYVQIETARVFLDIPIQAKISEIVKLPLSVSYSPY